MKELRGKTALVTGAASGIGRETALAFAREGSILLLVDIDAGGLEGLAGEFNGIGAECRTFITDVTAWEQVREMARRVSEEFGGLDILCNVAGVFIWADFVDTTLEDWDLIVKAVKRNRPLVVTTTPSRLLYYMNKISPSLVRIQNRPLRKFFNAAMR